MINMNLKSLEQHINVQTNCYNCKYYDSYGPSYYLKLETELHVCWKDVNITNNDPVKIVTDPSLEKTCFTPVKL